jgi:hypothetical protein
MLPTLLITGVTPHRLCQITAGVYDTGGQLTAGVYDTGGQFIAPYQ